MFQCHIRSLSLLSLSPLSLSLSLSLWSEITHCCRTLLLLLLLPPPYMNKCVCVRFSKGGWLQIQEAFVDELVAVAVVAASVVAAAVAAPPHACPLSFTATHTLDVCLATTHERSMARICRRCCALSLSPHRTKVLEKWRGGDVHRRGTLVPGTAWDDF